MKKGRLGKLKDRAKRAAETEEQTEARSLRKRELCSDRFATESGDQRGTRLRR